MRYRYIELSTDKVSQEVCVISKELLIKKFWNRNIVTVEMYMCYIAVFL